MNAPLRKILHVDMDAFFAAIEQRDRPEFRGKPVVVGGNPNGRGVVAAASYEARRFGIHSAMPAAHALRKCPEVVFVRPDFQKYSRASKIIQGILTQYTSLVEPMGMDEAYMDVTENRLKLADPVLLARMIKQNIKAVTGLTASAGVAPNKTLAKIASGMNKPDGLTVVAPQDVEKFLQDLPVRQIPGVGPVTEKTLLVMGIRTCGELAQWDKARLTEQFGKWGAGLWERARGIDNTPVITEWEPKQIGSEETFEKDLTDMGAMRKILGGLARDVVETLRVRNRKARTVTLKVKYGDFAQITRSHTLSWSFDDEATILREAVNLLETKTEAGRKKIRLLGISISGFGNGQEELDLFTPNGGASWR